ncbi:unnamed protein product [Caenorhabditis auriculariae]|uniref:Uncharacterized protein n=1 Tax=Caenorhabditis auriculariae TaxID=2777116 RepID=A0A8S1H442_9PELO|nr:unnamed protein product [Caenorhabditis auriculariae]
MAALHDELAEIFRISFERFRAAQQFTLRVRALVEEAREHLQQNDDLPNRFRLEQYENLYANHQVRVQQLWNEMELALHNLRNAQMLYEQLDDNDEGYWTVEEDAGHLDD